MSIKQMVKDSRKKAPKAWEKFDRDWRYNSKRIQIAMTTKKNKGVVRGVSRSDATRDNVKYRFNRTEAPPVAWAFNTSDLPYQMYRPTKKKI